MEKTYLTDKHINSVELIGYYGGDETHALSAWTSTRRELDEERLARLPQMLKTLAENGHETPFEKSFLHFLVTCDIASHIHMIKHRIAVSVNAESARYKELKENKYYVPPDWPFELQERLRLYTESAQEAYHAAAAELTPLLGRKRAKESARFFLPYNSQITSDVGFNFRSFIHFQWLRNNCHAQDEIHEIAEQMLDLVRTTGAFNHSLEAFGYAKS